MTTRDDRRRELAELLDEADNRWQHGVGASGYDPNGPPLWLADAVIGAGWVPVEGIETHNDQPVTAENLRWAATHESLARSWIFDVLMGLADRIKP